MTIYKFVFCFVCGIVLAGLALFAIFTPLLPLPWFAILTISITVAGGVITGVAIIHNTPSFKIAVLKTVIIVGALDALIILALHVGFPGWLASVFGKAWEADNSLDSGLAVASYLGIAHIVAVISNIVVPIKCYYDAEDGFNISPPTDMSKL